MHPWKVGENNARNHDPTSIWGETFSHVFCEVKGMSFGDYELRSVCGHIEVFLDGSFQFSADTVKEATDELRKEDSE